MPYHHFTKLKFRIIIKTAVYAVKIPHIYLYTAKIPHIEIRIDVAQRDQKKRES